MKKLLTYKDEKGITLVYVIVIILLLSIILAAILAAVANVNRESDFVENYEQMYYSAESASVVLAQTFMDQVATQLQEENKHSVQDAIDNGGIFYAVSTSMDFDIIAHTTEKLREILESVINSATIAALLEDELFEGQDFDWSVSVEGTPPAPPLFGTGFYVHYLNDLTASVTVKIGLRESTVNIHFFGSMDTNLGANDANMLSATTDLEKEFAMRGILAGRQAFFDMGGALVTGIDPNNPASDAVFENIAGDGGANISNKEVFLMISNGSPSAIAPMGGAGINNNSSEQMYIYPGQSLRLASNFQIQMSQMQNIFIEQNPLQTPAWRGGILIIKAGGVATSLHSTGRFVINTGNIHFDGRHAGEMNTITTNPMYTGAFNNLFGHIDTRAAQANGTYDYFSFHDYDVFYQPIGTNFYVSRDMYVDPSPYAGGTIHFINNGRFAVQGDLFYGHSSTAVTPFPSGTVMLGNSVYIAEGRITFNTAGDFTIGEKDIRAPHFISRQDLTINYVQGSQIKLYGIFGTLGRYYGPNFVDDPNVDVAGVIYAAGGYFDSATGLPFNVPADFFVTRSMASGTEYLDTSFFAEIFTLEDSSIISVKET